MGAGNSDTQVCNRALSWLGAAPISGLDGTSNEAVQCNTHYDMERITLIESDPWFWATKRLTMAQVTNDRTGEWTYAYALPEDCLRMHWVNDPDVATALMYSKQNPSAAFLIEGEVVYTHAASAAMEYVADIEDVTKMTALFQTALSWAVARSVAMPLTQDPRRVQLAEDKFTDALEKAQEHNASFNEHPQLAAALWMRNRDGIYRPRDYRRDVY